MRAVLFLRLAVRVQFLQGRRRDRDDAEFLILWFLQEDLVPNLRERAADHQPVAIEVRPLQAEQLPSPRPGGGIEFKKNVHAPRR